MRIESGLLVAAEFPRRHSGFLRENGVQILAVFKTRALGDLRQVPISVQEQIFDVLQSQTELFGFGRTAHMRSEAPFKDAPRHACGAGHFVRCEILKKMFAHEPRAGGQLAVHHGQHVGGAA